MKLALVIALAPDRRSGRVLSGILPADAAISQVKQAITADECPDASFPILQAVATDSLLREHRFKVTTEDVERDTEPPVTSTSGITLIPVEIGKGDDKTIINVTTDAEARFIRDLEAARALAVEEAAKAQAETLNVMQECDRLRKLAEGMDTANQRLATYEADLKSRDATIAELEEKLAKAKKK